MNFKTVFGYVTIFSILGFTTYAIHKHLKNKEVGGKSISYEEARDEVVRRKVVSDSYRLRLVEERNSEMDESSEPFEEMMDEVRDQAGFDRSFMKDHPNKGVPGKYEEEEEVTCEHGIGVECSECNSSTSREEDNKLKHDPSSQEALVQFVNMELSDWDSNDDSYSTLFKLFNFPFVPSNDGDHELKTKLIDYRVQFFGFNSKWVQDISFAEVILYYAKAATYNYDEDIRYWVKYFFERNGINHTMSSRTLDAVIERTNDHRYHNTVMDTYGIFGLTSMAIDKATQTAMRNVDGSLTYEIEFNEFLKSLN